MAENNVQLDLYLNSQPAEKKLDEFVVKAEESGKKAGEGISKPMEISFMSIGKMAAVAAAAVATTIVATMYKAVSAAKESELAVKQLNSALALSGEFSKQASLEMQNFASKMQESTGVSDESILGMLSYAKSLGATNEQAKKISETAINMSKVLGIDVQTASEQLTKSLTSGAGKLSAYDSGIKTLTDSQLKAGGAIDLLAQKFAGGAQASMQGFTGGTARLSVAFDELLEKLGKIVTDSPVLGAVINKVADFFFYLGEKIVEVTSKGDLFRDMAFMIADIGKALAQYVIPPFELAYNVVETFFNILVTGVNGAIAAFGQMGGLIANALGALGIENKFTEGLKNFAESSAQVLDDSIETVHASAAAVFDFPVAEMLYQKSEQVENFTNGVAESFATMAEQTELSTDKVAQASIDMTETINKAIAQGMVNAVTTGAQRLGTALVKGGLGFRDLKNFALEQIGDMAIMVGKAIVAMALTVETFKTSVIGAPGAAIAAGIGLIALGAAIKAFAGSSGGATAGGGVMAGSDAAGSAGNAIVSASQSEPEKKEVGPTVNLTVQGDVLDSDASSLRIVELLNSAFDKQGVTLRTA